MGTWGPAIFSNDISMDIKDEFFERYNRGEEASDIKKDLILDIDSDDKFNVIFALANCMWEVGALDEDFLLEIEKIISNKEDLVLAKELGADDKFIEQRSKNLEKFLKKISIKKEKPKKRIKPPVPIESKYRNGAVMIFKYDDSTWGALISVDSSFYDKETYYVFLQTNIYMTKKPTMQDVLNAYIMDSSFHNEEFNSFRMPKYYYSFARSISDYLKKIETKRFKIYNDEFFEVIGYLSEWEECCSGFSPGFNYKQKTYDEFKKNAMEILKKKFNEYSLTCTTMTVKEIDEEFISRKNK